MMHGLHRKSQSKPTTGQFGTTGGRRLATDNKAGFNDKIKLRQIVESLTMRNVCLGILICLTITACGTKGPLYIPEQRYPQHAN